MNFSVQKDGDVTVVGVGLVRATLSNAEEFKTCCCSTSITASLNWWSISLNVSLSTLPSSGHWLSLSKGLLRLMGILS